MCDDICPCRERLKATRRHLLSFGLVLSLVLLLAPGVIEDSERVVMLDRVHAEDAGDHDWKVSGASFYELYGNRTACGNTVTRDSKWVAVAIERRKEFPCGTLIRLEWHGRELVVPVLDVCPGCSRHGRLWDLTAGACHYLSQNAAGRPRCNTQPIAWTL